MRFFSKVLGSTCFAFFGLAAYGDDNSPSGNRFVLEYSLAASGFKFRVNDVPAMSPNYQIGTMGNIISRFPINQLLYKGRNFIEVEFKVKKKSEDGLRIRLSIKNSGLNSDVFSDDNYVFDFKVNVNHDDNSFEVVESKGNQSVSNVDFRKVSGSGMLEEWNKYRISFDLAYDFYESQYRNLGLALSDEDYDGVFKAYKYIYLAIESNSLKPLLKGFLDKYSHDTGMENDEIYESLFSDFLDPELNYELNNFDISNSKLVIVGNGKLALLDPSPISYSSDVLGEEERIMIMLWKDKNGMWNIKD